MRRERWYLQDIVDASAAVAGFIREVERAAFLGDELLQSAVIYKLVIIGEAAARVPQGVRAAHPEVPWRQVVGFRNLAVHEYFATDWEIVWHTASHDLPVLCEQIAAVLETLSRE